MYAAEHGRKATVSALIENNDLLDNYKIDKAGKTALMYASSKRGWRHGNDIVLSLLEKNATMEVFLKNTANVDIQSNNGDSSDSCS